MKYKYKVIAVHKTFSTINKRCCSLKEAKNVRNRLVKLSNKFEVVANNFQ